MHDSMDRRKFLKSTVLAGAAASLAGGGSSSAASLGRRARTVMDLRTDPMERVRIGFVGLGNRGGGAVGRYLSIEGVEIAALCDIRPDRVAAAQKRLADKGRPAAKEFGSTAEDWKRMCDMEGLDLVYNCTPWDLHAPISVYTMEAGKHAAVEVPAAITMDECWDMVNTAERTRKHCMMLENCCYGETELLMLNMCRLGLLGELVHGEGAYIHDLRVSKFRTVGGYQDLWRLRFSQKYNGNPYPTHGLGPIAQYMGINRGDRFQYLSSMSSLQRGMTVYAEEKFGPDSPEARTTYRMGDVSTTIIRTVKGRTIMVQHDTTSPRPYTRINTIVGTKGTFTDYPPRLALDPNSHNWIQDEALKEYYAKYRHPLWTKVGDIARKVGGHGGMDFIMDWRLVHCLRNGEPLDQSVYDAAAWSCIFPLSRQSVAGNGESVKVPDFTRGVWEKTPPLGIVS
jgi:predicted dehydrogenase